METYRTLNARADMGINYSVDLLRRDEGQRTHIRTELELIRKEYEIRDCTVLELGCGLGHNLDVFKADNRVIGIEGLPSAVAQARERGANVFEGNLDHKLDIDPNSADWVLCMDVLEHLSNPMNLLLQAREILRSNGRMILNVPNHFNWIGRAKILLGHNLDVHNFFPECHEWDNPHLRFFTHRGITQMIQAAGFEVLEDRSPRIWSSFEGVQFASLQQFLARKSPALFAPGFFLIIKRAG